MQREDEDEPDVVVSTVLAEPGTLMLIWDEDAKEVKAIPVILWVTLENGDSLPSAYGELGYCQTGIEHFGLHMANGSAAFNETITDEMYAEYRKLTLYGEDRYKAGKARDRRG